MSIMRRCIVAVAAMVVAGSATSTRAQVLHEHVDVAAVRCANGVCWRAGRASDGAAAILSDGEVVPAPAGGPPPPAGGAGYSPAAGNPPLPRGRGPPPPRAPAQAPPAPRPRARP